jgi:hypothetical protein
VDWTHEIPAPCPRDRDVEFRCINVRTPFISATVVAWAALSLPVSGQAVAFEDQITRLEKKIETGEVKLDYQPNATGYLTSLLHNLGVNIDSQLLVFSKTSFQAPLVSPAKPRAVYFNDSVSVGFVQGGEVFELIAVQPAGLVFYTLNAHPSDQPRFERRSTECLNCHGPVNVLAPGLMVTSVIPNAEGTPLYTGILLNTTDHRTPFESRWGGWYVTGSHGSQQHMGNAIAPDPGRPGDLETTGAQNLTSLETKLDTSAYLAPASDIVALMTLEHQTRMTNLIISASAQSRALQDTGETDVVRNNRLNATIENLVRYMVFADEAALREPVKGVSTFTETFPRRGPRDRRGRSLRDFDLQTRLFRYPLSYMVYSEIFDRMEDTIRERVYQRLYDVLTGRDISPKFAKLTADDRRSVLEILRDTKPDLPAYWRAVSASRP